VIGGEIALLWINLFRLAISLGGQKHAFFLGSGFEGIAGYYRRHSAQQSLHPGFDGMTPLGAASSA
jgi:hypothetical protein